MGWAGGVTLERTSDKSVFSAKTPPQLHVLVWILSWQRFSIKTMKKQNKTYITSSLLAIGPKTVLFLK